MRVAILEVRGLEPEGEHSPMLRRGSSWRCTGRWCRFLGLVPHRFVSPQLEEDQRDGGRQMLARVNMDCCLLYHVAFASRLTFGTGSARSRTLRLLDYRHDIGDLAAFLGHSRGSGLGLVGDSNDIGRHIEQLTTIDRLSIVYDYLSDICWFQVSGIVNAWDLTGYKGERIGEGSLACRWNLDAQLAVGTTDDQRMNRNHPSCSWRLIIRQQNNCNLNGSPLWRFLVRQKLGERFQPSGIERDLTGLRWTQLQRYGARNGSLNKEHLRMYSFGAIRTMIELDGGNNKCILVMCSRQLN